MVGSGVASCFSRVSTTSLSLRPQSFAAFLDAFTDTVHAGGLAAVRPATPPRPGPPVLPAAPRVIAVGDLHGDASKARRALRLAGVLGQDDRWCGGGSVVVQVGDILDRGDGELSLLHLLERLSNEAAAAGGAVHTLHGNHETLNVAGRFRYATRGGSQAFAHRAAVEALAAAWKRRCGCDGGGDGADVTGLTEPIALDEASTRAAATPARAAALRPGGPVTTRFLAPSRVVLQIGSSVFVHGGVLPSHGVHGAAGMAAINESASAWMRGEPSHTTMPPILGGRDAVVWARDYSHEDAASCDCECVVLGVGVGGREERRTQNTNNQPTSHPLGDSLRVALQSIPGAARMVMGHTIQEAGVNGACGGAALRVDVGLSAGCGDGRVQVLEILNDGATVRVLREGEVPVTVPGDRGGGRATGAAVVAGGRGGGGAAAAAAAGGGRRVK